MKCEVDPACSCSSGGVSSENDHGCFPMSESRSRSFPNVSVHGRRHLCLPSAVMHVRDSYLVPASPSSSILHHLLLHLLRPSASSNSNPVSRTCRHVFDTTSDSERPCPARLGYHVMRTRPSCHCKTSLHVAPVDRLHAVGAPFDALNGIQDVANGCHRASCFHRGEWEKEIP